MKQTTITTITGKTKTIAIVHSDIGSYAEYSSRTNVIYYDENYEYAQLNLEHELGHAKLEHKAMPCFLKPPSIMDDEIDAWLVAINNRRLSIDEKREILDALISYWHYLGRRLAHLIMIEQFIKDIRCTKTNS